MKYETGGLWVTFPFKKLPEMPPKGSLECSPKGSPESSLECSPKGSPESSLECSPKTSELIIELIRNNSHITTMIMASQLGISKRAVIKHTNKLQETGRVRRVGSKKGGHWEVID